MFSSHSFDHRNRSACCHGTANPCHARLTCRITQSQAETAVREKAPLVARPLKAKLCLLPEASLPIWKSYADFGFFSLAAFVPAIALKSRPHPTRCCRIAEAASTALNAMPTKSCFYHSFPYLEDLNCLSGAQRLSGVWPSGISNRLSSSMLFESPADMPLIDPWVLWQGASKDHTAAPPSVFQHARCLRNYLFIAHYYANGMFQGLCIINNIILTSLDGRIPETVRVHHYTEWFSSSYTSAGRSLIYCSFFFFLYQASV